MKKILFFSVIALSALMVSCSQSAPAADDEKEKQESTTPPSAELNAIRLAQDLALYGYETESASALIEAANILISTPTQALEAEVVKGESATEETEKEGGFSLEPKDLIAAAKEFAGDDEVLLSSIAKLEGKLAALGIEATRGAFVRGKTTGPAYSVTRVYAKATDTYSIRFRGGELAEIAVSGDGDTDLDLYVYDENGNLIKKDIDYTDQCYVSFVPAWTGSFIVKVVNRGSVYNNYTLVTN